MKKWLILVLALLTLLPAQQQKRERRISYFELPFGIKPNMSKAKLDQHKADYIAKASKFAKRENKNTGIDWDSPYGNSYEQLRFNIDAYDKLKEIGIDFFEAIDQKFYSGGDPNYLANTLETDVAVLGNIVGIEYLTEGVIGTIYSLKISDVIADKGYFQNKPDTIHIISPNNKQYYYSGTFDYNLNDFVLIFGNVAIEYYSYKSFLNMKNRKTYMFYAENALFITKDGVFNANYKTYEKSSFDEIKSKISTIAKINDAKNFYNRSYK